MNVPGAISNGPGIDKTYIFNLDLEWFTSVLINSGYKLYQIKDLDDEIAYVWAKHFDLQDGMVALAPSPWPAVTTKSIIIRPEDDQADRENPHIADAGVAQADLDIRERWEVGGNF